MNTNPALILFSHGSLLCGSGAGLLFHVERLRESGRYRAVEPGYLNYCDPPVEKAIERCVAAGADTVVVVPYFLVAGKFVTENLPQRLTTAMAAFPGTRFMVARALEDSAMMPMVVEQSIKTAVDVRQWQEKAVKKARAQCELRTDCPLYGSAMCRAEKETAIND